MEWIKIKAHHMLITTLSMSEKGMLVSIQALAAHLERVPSDDEIARLPGMGRKAFASLSDKLRNIDEPLSLIVRKVIADVLDVQQDRDRAKERKRKSRGLSSSEAINVTRDIAVTSQGSHGVDKISIDKIREDNKPSLSVTPVTKCEEGDEKSISKAKEICEEYCREIIRQKRSSQDPIKNPIAYRKARWGEYLEFPDEAMHEWLIVVAPIRKKRDEEAALKEQMASMLAEEAAEKEAFYAN